MVLIAKHYKDKGELQYTALLHTNAAGLAMKKTFVDGGLEPTAVNYAGVFATLHNHSAWRQKFEKAGIFPKATARDVTDQIASLEEELG